LTGSCHQVNGNTVYNVSDSYDAQTGNGNDQHADAIFCVLYPTDPTQYIYDNLVYGVSEGTEGPFFIEPGAQHRDGSAATAYVFNNTVYYGDWGQQLVLDNRCFGSGCNPANWVYHVWNNTAVQNATGCPAGTLCTGPTVSGKDVTSLACVVVGAGQDATLGTVDLQNNHCGSNFAGPKIYSLGTGITVTTLTDTNNLLMSLVALTTDGYTVANQFQPTSSGNPTVAAGANLTASASGPLSPLLESLNAFDPATPGTARPSSASGSCPGAVGCWDVGAYQCIPTGDGGCTAPISGLGVDGGAPSNGDGGPVQSADGGPTSGDAAAPGGSADAGSSGAADAANDGASGGGSSGGCACDLAPQRSTPWAASGLVFVAWLAARRRPVGARGKR
jgi:hypothetical protein